jgi:probable HAF family extracellular repeat protein
MRRFLTSFFTLLVCALYQCTKAPVRASEPSNYAIDDLGTLGGFFTGPAGLNDRGDVVGFAQTATFEYHAFLFTDEGGLRDLGAHGGVQSQAFGVNRSRHVAGTFTRADGTTGAFLDGADIGMVDLGSLGGRFGSAARDVNDAGEVVGLSYLPSDVAHAFRWTSTDGMQDLGTLGVRWTVGDPETGIASTSGCDTETVGEETAA